MVMAALNSARVGGAIVLFAIAATLATYQTLVALGRYDGTWWPLVQKGDGPGPTFAAAWAWVATVVVVSIALFA